MMYNSYQSKVIRIFDISSLKEATKTLLNIFSSKKISRSEDDMKKKYLFKAVILLQGLLVTFIFISCPLNGKSEEDENVSPLTVSGVLYQRVPDSGSGFPLKRYSPSTGDTIAAYYSDNNYKMQRLADGTIGSNGNFSIYIDKLPSESLIDISSTNLPVNSQLLSDIQIPSNIQIEITSNTITISPANAKSCGIILQLVNGKTENLLYCSSDSKVIPFPVYYYDYVYVDTDVTINGSIKSSASFTIDVLENNVKYKINSTATYNNIVLKEGWNLMRVEQNSQVNIDGEGITATQTLNIGSCGSLIPPEDAHWYFWDLGT